MSECFLNALYVGLDSAKIITISIGFQPELPGHFLSVGHLGLRCLVYALHSTYTRHSIADMFRLELTRAVYLSYLALDISPKVDWL